MITKNNIGNIINFFNNTIPKEKCILLSKTTDSGVIRIYIITDIIPQNDIYHINYNGLNFEITYHTNDELYTKTLISDLCFLRKILDTFIIRDDEYLIRNIMLVANSLFVNKSMSPSVLEPDIVTDRIREIQNQRSNKSLVKSILNLLKEHPSLMDTKDENTLIKIDDLFRDLYTTKWNNNSDIEQKLLKLSKETPSLEREYVIRICVEADYDLADLLEFIFFRLSKYLKKYLITSEFIIEKSSNKNYSKVSFINYYFESKTVRDLAEYELKRSLFNDISELNLSKISFDKKHIVSITSNHISQIYDIQQSIYKKLSSQILRLNAKEKISTDRAVALCLYFYICAGNLYFGDSMAFRKASRSFFDYMVLNSISGITSEIVDSISLSEKKGKLEKEYNKIFYKIEHSIAEKYIPILHNIDYESSSFEFSSSLSRIKGILSLDDISGELYEILDYTPILDINKVDQYFFGFIKKSFNIFFFR